MSALQNIILNTIVVILALSCIGGTCVTQFSWCLYTIIAMCSVLCRITSFFVRMTAYILFEHAAGYALFKNIAMEDIGSQLDQVFYSFYWHLLGIEYNLTLVLVLRIGR